MTKARRTRRALKNALNAASKRKSVPTMPVAPWDTGAAGPANRAGLVIEDAADIDPQTGRIINPNGVKRARRVDMLEVWHRQGTITTAGFNAAERLRDAFEATQRAPGWPDNDRVQASPKPDHAVTIQIDRLSRFHDANRCVSPQDRLLIDRCVLGRGTPASAGYKGRKYEAGLRHMSDALDRLAAAMSKRG